MNPSDRPTANGGIATSHRTVMQSDAHEAPHEIKLYWNGTGPGLAVPPDLGRSCWLRILALPNPCAKV